MKVMVTAERLREVIRYDESTGHFFWRERDRAKRTDIPAGTVVPPGGYRQITVDHRAYLAHRLAWLYVTGGWPKKEIDHLDGNPDNNRFSNLRDVDHQTNMLSMFRPNRDNKLGFLGVTRSGSRFKAALKLNDVCYHLGQFNTPEEAHAAYLAAKALVKQKGMVPR